MNSGRNTRHRPTVAMVSNTYYPADPRLRRQAEALVRHGYAVDVLCQRQTGEAAREDVQGVRVLRIGRPRYRGASVLTYGLSHAAFFVRATLTLARTQMQRGYAAVQVYSMPEALILSALGPRLAGVPLIYDAGDLTSELFSTKFGTRGGRILLALVRAQERLCLRLADLVITVHEDYRRRLLARGVPDERLRITMNLPDPLLFERALRTTAPREDGAFVIVHHGSLVERYGADLAIQAVARLRDRIPDLRLELYGDGDLRPRLEQLVEELDLSGRVIVHPGFVPLDALLPALAAADAAIVPHRADPFTETILPNKLLEYLALGLPTIVTRTRTVQAHVPEEVVAYCAPNDAQALADSIAAVWADFEYRQRLASNARQFSETHSWTEAASRYCADIARLVARRRTPSTTGQAA
jgi:glycosyltransferase involved in cell wall biosynthesis